MPSNINLSYVKDMLGDDPEVVRSFVAEIIDQMKETELLISNFIAQKNFQEISATAHKVKSILQMVGAEKLYQKIQELELTAKTSDDINEINSLYRSVEVLSSDCRRKLEEIV